MKSIKKIRGRLGLTQKDLSELANIPRTYLVALERDDCHNISPTIIKKLCNVLKVDKFELLGINVLKYIPETKEEAIYVKNLLEEMIEKWD